jgi:hypothetical protein
MIQGFDWHQWADEANKYLDNRKMLATADVTILQKLFTSIIRSDRFCEGLLGDMIDKVLF